LEGPRLQTERLAGVIPQLDQATARQIAEQYLDSHQGRNDVTLDPLWRSPFGANSVLSTFLPMLMAITGVVLMLACANGANLMLVRSVARRRELAIRLSMGGSRWSLSLQELSEAIALPEFRLILESCRHRNAHRTFAGEPLCQLLRSLAELVCRPKLRGACQ
jgi:hypothetical protein